jgi:molecular chaperone HscB
LGLTPRFELDPKELEQRQRELSRALHPDRYVGAPAGERRRALGGAMDVNRAYRELRDPVARSQALLTLLGVGAEVFEKARVEPGFLMDVLEQREALAEARATSDLARVQELGRSMEAQQRELLVELGALFDEGELAHALRNAATPAWGGELPPALEKALAAVSKLRYVRRFLDEVTAFEDEAG